MRVKLHRPSPALIVACTALLVVLGGTGVAAVTAVPNNSVGTAQLKNNAVTAAKIASNAVASAKIASNAVTSAKIASNAITSAKVEDHSLESVDFAPGQLPRGPQGPTGPAGTVGKLDLRTTSVTVPKSNSTERSATCPSGEQAISGGATWQHTGDLNETLVYSGPVYDNSKGIATGWVARGRNQTGGDQTFIVQVLCAKV